MVRRSSPSVMKKGFKDTPGMATALSCSPVSLLASSLRYDHIYDCWCCTFFITSSKPPLLRFRCHLPYPVYSVSVLSATMTLSCFLLLAPLLRLSVYTLLLALVPFCALYLHTKIRCISCVYLSTAYLVYLALQPSICNATSHLKFSAKLMFNPSIPCVVPSSALLSMNKKYVALLSPIVEPMHHLSYLRCTCCVAAFV